jgi:CelD/BcsL family acetyltransferase involved in cellulose biosynthesis
MREGEKALLLDASDEAWAGFAASNTQANIFHHPAWINLLAECYRYRPFIVAVCDSAGGVRAGIPMMEVRSRLTGRRWVSLPFSDHCAPLYEDAGALESLLEYLVDLSQARETPRIEVRWGLPEHPAVHSRSLWVLHTLGLDAAPERLCQRFHRSQWQNVRSAENRGVHIEWGERLEQLRVFYHLQWLTRRRHGLPVQPWRFFELLWRTLIQEGLGFLLLAYEGDRCLAGGIFLHWQQTLTYKYAASAEDSRGLRPNHLLTWTAMRWGCENGLARFDFGRSDVEDLGLRAFKHRWGAEETSLAYSTLSAGPERPVGSRLMGVMHAVIRASPVWVCRAVGELLYGHFG